MRRWSIRARVTAVSTVALAVVLVLIGLVLVHALRVGLTNRLDRQLRNDAELATLRTAAVDDLSPTVGGGRIAQVVASDGTVLWSSSAAGGEAAPAILGRPLPFSADSGSHLSSVDSPTLGELRVLAVPRAGSDEWLVLARSEELGNTAGRAVVRTVVVMVPLLVVGLGFLVWFGVGRALRPVETIRSTVGEISEHHLSTRVPVPDTGDEVARLAVTMNEMLDRLDAAAGRERRLVADASHELRSPLASVRALLETRASAEDPTAHDAEAMAAVLRLQDLVEQLLVLASQDAGPVASPRPVDLDDLVMERAAALRATTPLVVDTAAVSGAQVLGSREGMQRVVDNLAANGARHAASRVRFELRERSGRARLVVSDDGPGVPVADRERVFERFTRLDEARDRDRAGAGLGLAIVAGVVAAHGGTVQLDADPELGGARVVVDLPALAPAPPAAPI